MRQVNDIRQHSATVGTQRMRATLRRLGSLGVALLLVASFSPAGHIEPVAAETTGDALAWDNTPSLGNSWPYELTGVPGQTIKLHGTGRFGVQWGFAPTATYAALTPAVCTVDGSVVSVLATGECGIRVSIPGDHLFAAASADTSFTVGAQRIFIGGSWVAPSAVPSTMSPYPYETRSLIPQQPAACTGIVRESLGSSNQVELGLPVGRRARQGAGRNPNPARIAWPSGPASQSRNAAATAPFADDLTTTPAYVAGTFAESGTAIVTTLPEAFASVT